MVAGEYIVPQRAEGGREPEVPPVVIHQIDAYRKELPDATALMERMGQARVVWHQTDPSEMSAPRGVSKPQYPRSLRQMRSAILRGQRLLAMVCIGGMEGVEEEVDLCAELQPTAPIFILSSTGGACFSMSQSTSKNRRLRAIDTELLNNLRPRLRGANGESRDAPLNGTPYAFIMQRIIREISDRNEI